MYLLFWNFYLFGHTNTTLECWSHHPLLRQAKFRDQEELKFRVPSEFSTNDWEKHVQFQSWKLNACYFWIMNLHECVKRWVKICEISNLIKDQRSNSTLFLLGINLVKPYENQRMCVDQLPFLRTRFRDSTSSSELASRKPCCAGSGALPGRVKSTVFQPAWAVRR